MARDGPKQGNSTNNDGGDRSDSMSMRQLTEALTAVTNQPRPSHENQRVAAIQRRIHRMLSESMIEAIRHMLHSNQHRDRLRRHRRQRPNSPQDQPEG